MLAALRQDESTLDALLRLLEESQLGWVLLVFLAVTVVAHVTLATLVFVHSRKVELQYLPRSGWTLMVLSSGLFAAIAYWIIHVVAAKERKGAPESQGLEHQGPASQEPGSQGPGGTE